jgi:Zn-dependent M16 (insulinase) family peptidase
LEDDPHETIAHSAIHDFLYNPRKNGDELKHVMDEIERLNEMATKGEDFWLDMISKFLLDAPHVAIIGRPSESLGKRMADDEQNRVEKQVGLGMSSPILVLEIVTNRGGLYSEQKQDLGEEKLAELEVKLKDAIEKNEVPVPPEIIRMFSK